MSDSDTDTEYEQLKVKLDVMLADGSSSDDYSEEEQRYLENVSSPDVDYVDDAKDLLELGCIYSIIDDVIIVSSNSTTQPLDLGTMAVLPDRTVIGLIGDTFGPINSPFYSVKINPKFSRELSENMPILYCPSISNKINRSDLNSSESESEREC